MKNGARTALLGRPHLQPPLTLLHLLHLQPKDGSKRSTRGVFKVTDKVWLEKLFKESEYEAGAPIARPGFRVVVTTNLAADAIKEKLAHLIPLTRCNIIAVKQQ